PLPGNGTDIVRSTCSLYVDRGQGAALGVVFYNHSGPQKRRPSLFWISEPGLAGTAGRHRLQEELFSCAKLFSILKPQAWIRRWATASLKSAAWKSSIEALPEITCTFT